MAMCFIVTGVLLAIEPITTSIVLVVIINGGLAFSMSFVEVGGNTLLLSIWSPQEVPPCILSTSYESSQYCHLSKRESPI
jgi:hypothetical protein